ncbi:unnamed protein product [Dimorphilus gyrociliatus]|uniref:Uncharacterized protein n=1 Tax=Dimorphilus gyrociliatus TaxID=2664684 RepID=A0A7I8V7S6_9ANNE|nr:unnamed protein product [Dimorphilus gyrociliatus]
MPKRRKFKNVEIGSCEFIINSDTVSSRRVRRKKKRDKDSKKEDIITRDSFVTKSLSSDTGFSEPSQIGDSPIHLTDSIEEAVRWEISKMVEERRRTQEPMLDVQLPSFIKQTIEDDKDLIQQEKFNYLSENSQNDDKGVNIWEQLKLIDLDDSLIETVEYGGSRVEFKLVGILF